MKTKRNIAMLWYSLRVKRQLQGASSRAVTAQYHRAARLWGFGISR